MELKQTVAKLREYASGRGLKIHKGGCFRIVVMGNDEPAGELCIRPEWLKWDPDFETVWAHFSLTLEGGKTVWASAPYYFCLKAFLFNCPYYHFGSVLSHPELHYYSDHEREQRKSELDKRTEVEPWLNKKASSKALKSG